MESAEPKLLGREVEWQSPNKPQAMGVSQHACICLSIIAWWVNPGFSEDFISFSSTILQIWLANSGLFQPSSWGDIVLTEKPTPSQFSIHLSLEFLTFKAHLHLIIYDVLFPFSYMLVGWMCGWGESYSWHFETEDSLLTIWVWIAGDIFQ